MSKNYRWLLFDADDTLFDYQHAETLALENTFREFALEYQASTLELYRTYNQQLWLQLERREISSELLRKRRFELLFQDLKCPLPSAFSDAYVERFGEQTALNDGALEMLQTLSRRFKCAIITNGMAQVQYARLARSPIRPYISELIISEEVGFAKPAPEIFDAAFRRLNHPARREVLMIGDSLSSDMLGGLRYQLDTCWYNPRQLARPDDLPFTLEIHHFRELCEWLA